MAYVIAYFVPLPLATFTLPLLATEAQVWVFSKPSISAPSYLYRNQLSMHMCTCSVVSDSVTPWTVAHQAPLSMEFSREEYCSGLPFPSPGDLPNSEIEPGSLALQTDSLPSAPPGKPSQLSVGGQKAFFKPSFIIEPHPNQFFTWMNFSGP